MHDGTRDEHRAERRGMDPAVQTFFQELAMFFDVRHVVISAAAGSLVAQTGAVAGQVATRFLVAPCL